MKLLLAPLNWGLGHASRCVPLVRRFLEEGHEVILGGDGESLTLLRKHFPALRYVYLAPLNLRYSAGQRQVWAMIKAIPKLILWSIKDHTILQSILREEHIDQVISDNRFGLFLSKRATILQRSGLTAEGGLTAKRSYSVSGQTQSVYITHQLHIMLPKGWKWLEPLAERLHARIYLRFDEVWVPDYEDFDQSLAGDLSHLKHQTSNIKHLKYIGPLSRFSYSEAVLQPKAVLQQSGLIAKGGHYDVVVVLSGLEPHRSLLEQEIIRHYTNYQSSMTNEQSPITNHQSVLIVEGQLNKPATTIKRGNITIVPSLDDDSLVAAFLSAKHIIVRSGYSTIMDLHALGLLTSNIKHQTSNIEFLPTPGQPEQEYLAQLHQYSPQKNEGTTELA